MIEWIKNFWIQYDVGNKLYVVYAVLVVFSAAMAVWQYVDSRPRKLLDFIVKAQKENCTAIGKMTCLTLHGAGLPEYYQAEYMYIVDGKRYFVTYKMAFDVHRDSRTSCMNADMLLLNLKPALILFYDKKKPKKAVSKLEVFTSENGIRQVRTDKHNVYRDTEKIWYEPIDLVV